MTGTPRHPIAVPLRRPSSCALVQNCQAVQWRILERVVFVRIRRHLRRPVRLLLEPRRRRDFENGSLDYRFQHQPLEEQSAAHQKRKPDARVE